MDILVTKLQNTGMGAVFLTIIERQIKWYYVKQCTIFSFWVVSKPADVIVDVV